MPNLRLGLLTSLLLPAPLLGQNWFHAPRTYDFLTGEYRLHGDVDLDGDVDLVSFDRSAVGGLWYRAQVWTNDGSGQFAAGAFYLLVGDTAESVLLADVTGDGLPDLLHSTAATSAVGPGLAVMAGQPGAQFAAPVVVPLPGRVRQLAIGDADADGDRDVLLVHATSTTSQLGDLRWLLWGPGATWQLGPITSLGANGNTFDLAAADLDGDLRSDAIVLVPGELRMLATTPASGFAAPVAQAIAGVFVGALATGDLDGDADVDLVVSTDGAPALRLRNDGGGVFTAVPLPVVVPVASGRPFLGDWDGDGDLDMFLRENDAAGAAFSQWRNDGAAGFASAQRSLTGLAALGRGTGLADVDGDGALDWIDGKAVWFGDRTLRAVLGPVTTNTTRFVDVDDDGDRDAVINQLGYGRNDGTGALTSLLLAPPPAGPGLSWASSPGGDDLDGDGFQEHLVARVQATFPISTFDRVMLLRDAGNGTLTVVGDAAAPGLQMFPPLLFGDFDQDGDRDVVNSTGLWRNNGALFFDPPTTVVLGQAPLAAGDVDGDLDLDIVFGTGAGQPMTLARQTAPGVFTTSALPLGALAGASLADLDDDGDLDLLVAPGSPQGTVVTVHANVGGTFTTALQVPWGADLGATRVLAEDVDGDGNSDLVVATGTRLHVFRRVGPGLVFDGPRSYLAQSVREFADFDGDGDRDALGVSVTFAAARRGPAAGRVRQYGSGSAGTNGAQPVLGAVGPLRSPGSFDLRVRRAVGGGVALLVLGVGETMLPLPGFPGVTVWVDPIVDALPLLLTGTPGTAAVGALDLPVVLPPGLGGFAVFAQVVVADAGANSGIAASNGLELRFGF